MKKFFILLSLLSLSKVACADSQVAHIYGDEARGYEIDDDNYAINITYDVAANTPDGSYSVEVVFDGGPREWVDPVTITSGVCNPASRLFYPDPAGGHPGRVLYFGAGNHTWHAYLSTQTTPQAVAVNARDRIGPGPWYNAKGQLIASNVADLHGDQQRDRNNIQKANVLTEKGEVVKGFGDMPNEHDMMTGSDSDGRAFPGGFDTTCNNWTSDGTDHRSMLGHSDRSGGGNTSWNSTHPSRGCSQPNLVSTGGAGLLYCFAVN
jgi:hypothetical protein